MKSYAHLARSFSIRVEATVYRLIIALRFIVECLGEPFSKSIARSQIENENTFQIYEDVPDYDAIIRW